jgi:phosphoserine phosphatase RsbU/P
LPTRSRSIPAGPEAARTARRFLQEVVEGRVPPDVLSSSLLLTSELVTNAVRHGGTELGEGIEVVVAAEHDVVRVLVRDNGEGFTPDQPQVLREDGGWGLHLVRTLASNWNVERHGTTTEVWFEVQSPPGRQRG